MQCCFPLLDLVILVWIDPLKKLPFEFSPVIWYLHVLARVYSFLIFFPVSLPLLLMRCSPVSFVNSSHGHQHTCNPAIASSSARRGNQETISKHLCLALGRLHVATCSQCSCNKDKYMRASQTLENFNQIIGKLLE